MQGLILAAGMGSRLGEYTKDVPKVLVEVAGQPLIMHALERLLEQGVEETIIVVGYMKESIMEQCGDSYKGMKLKYVINERYETTNNVYSFYLAMKVVKSDVLMVEGDLLFSSKVLEVVLREKRDCNIVVSRYNPNTMNGTVIETGENSDIARALVIKKRQGKDYDYENAWKTVNIYYFGQTFIEKKFRPTLDLYISNGNLNNYYEFVLGALIYYGDDDIRIVPVDEEMWFEVDDERDLMIARENGGF